MAERRPSPAYDRAEFIAWLADSCQRQGVPMTITDPGVLGQVAVLLRDSRSH